MSPLGKSTQQVYLVSLLSKSTQWVYWVSLLSKSTWQVHLASSLSKSNQWVHLASPLDEFTQWVYSVSPIGESTHPLGESTQQVHLASPLGESTWWVYSASPLSKSTWWVHLASPLCESTWQVHSMSPIGELQGYKISLVVNCCCPRNSCHCKNIFHLTKNHKYNLWRRKSGISELKSVIPSACPLPVPKHTSRCLHHCPNKCTTPPSPKVELPFDMQVLVWFWQIWKREYSPLSHNQMLECCPHFTVWSYAKWVGQWTWSPPKMLFQLNTALQINWNLHSHHLKCNNKRANSSIAWGVLDWTQWSVTVWINHQNWIIYC